jgi:S1-C subfamily serine protease
MDEIQYHAPRPRPRPNATPLVAWAALLLAVIVGFFAWQLARRAAGPPPQAALHNPDARPRPVAPRGELGSEEQAQIELYREAAPSVVHVTAFTDSQDLEQQDLERLGSGSGFIWDAEGHVVTNFHVVRNGAAFRVTLFDGSVHEALPVGGDPDKDVAVLKIDAPESLLRPIPVGESSKLQVGQKVFAIGNPYGLDQTLTTGVISGLGREIQSITERTIFDVIQTDAAINPGNSGGPLLDSAGRLIGINTAIYSPSGAYAGIGFAVPVDTVNRAVPQIIRTGRVQRPGLGVTILPDTIVIRLRQAGVFDRRGVLFESVLEGSAADEAGLLPTVIMAGVDPRLGDLIVAVDGQPIETVNDLFRALDRHRVGDRITLTLIRDGEIVEVPLTLKPLPES